MFQILLTEEIKAPKDIVWDVIANTKEYPIWNKFVVACESSFQVGSPIKMQVRVLPFFAMPQKETIFQYKEGELIEYGMKLPFGLLSSSRKHILSELDESTTKYESVFELQGLLSSLVGVLLGSQLRRGFGDMSSGIASRSLKVKARESL